MTLGLPTVSAAHGMEVVNDDDVDGDGDEEEDDDDAWSSHCLRGAWNGG